ncbi:MAG: hypothetical protein EKK53_28315 [Burkholderiales bacterium]|nr:MAG: hypothetical protein EKK53_28315 [Burkholderiales bacterium]
MDSLQVPAAGQQEAALLSCPPDGYVPLSDLARALGQRVDALSRLARISMVPDALRVERREGTRSVAWYLPGRTADGLIAQHQAGHPMPWQGKPLVDDLAGKYRLWCVRRHPSACLKCHRIWGHSEPPANFEAYVARYTRLSLGDKAHLTQLWAKPRPLSEAMEHLVRLSGHDRVVEALENGALRTLERDGRAWMDSRVIDEWSAAGYPQALPSAQQVWALPSTAAASSSVDVGQVLWLIEHDEVQARMGSGPVSKGRLFVDLLEVGAVIARRGLSACAPARVDAA